MTVIFGREVVSIEKKHIFPYIELEDGTKIEYDGLLLATGSRPMITREVPNLTDNMEKSFMIRDMKDHQRLRKTL